MGRTSSAYVPTRYVAASKQRRSLDRPIRKSTDNFKTDLDLWSRSSSIRQREHHNSPLHRSTG